MRARSSGNTHGSVRVQRVHGATHHPEEFMSHFDSSKIVTALALTSALLLSACGGAVGTGDATDSPTPSDAAAPADRSDAQAPPADGDAGATATPASEATAAATKKISIDVMGMT